MAPALRVPACWLGIAEHSGVRAPAPAGSTGPHGAGCWQMCLTLGAPIACCRFVQQELCRVDSRLGTFNYVSWHYTMEGSLQAGLCHNCHVLVLVLAIAYRPGAGQQAPELAS